MFTADQIKRFEARRQAELAASRPQPTMPKKSGNFLSSLIQEGGAIGGATAGAAAGSAILPGLGTLIGAGLGGFAGSLGGGLAESKVRDNKYDLGSNLKEASLDAVLSAGPLKLVKGASSATKAARAGVGLKEALKTGGKEGAEFTLRGAVGKKTLKAGDNLIAKQFRLTPTQQFNFMNKHGIKATEAIKQSGINNAEDLGKILPSLYDEFGRIAKSVPEFKTSEVTAALKSTYTPLLDSVLPANRQLGQQLKTISDDIAKRYKKTIPSAIVNNIRQEADSAVRYTLKGTADEGANRQTASTLRKLMQDMADKNGLKSTQGLSFKDVGRKISQLEDLAEITGRQKFLGTGSLPLSLPTLLGGVAGGAAFGPAGIGTAAAVGAINSNAGRKVINKGTQKLGEALTSSATKAATTRGVATNAARNISLESALGAGQSSNNTASIPNTMPNNIAPNSAVNMTDTIPQPQPQSQGLTKDQYLQAVMIDLATTGGENLGQIKAVFEMLAPQETAATKPLSGELQKRVGSAESGLRSLSTLEEALINDPGAFQRQALPNPLGITARLTGTSEVRAATDNVIDVIARLRSGAAITDAEAARFARLLPQAGDDLESAQYKLSMVRAELENVLNQAGQGGGDPLQEALMQLQAQ